MSPSFRRVNFLLPLLLTLSPSISHAQPTSQPASPSRPFVTPATASSWYKARLGNTVDASRLYKAHLLVEEFFTSIPSKRRQEIISTLEELSITPKEAVTLCSLRLRWQTTEPGVYYINDTYGAFPVKYFVAIPRGYTPAEPRPLVLMLPTATAFAVKKDMTPEDVAAIYTNWLKDELTRRPDNIVIMPLLHLTDLWGPGYAGMNNAMKPLFDACERFSVDPTRVYLRGQGMSGHAVWNLALHYPTYFAAFNPLAGGASYDFQKLRAINLRNTLPVVWHDADDTAVPVKLSRDLVGLLRRNKIEVEYEETKKVGHIPGPDIDNRLYTKMSARRRNLSPLSVSLRNTRPDVAFNRVDWLQVWQPLDPGTEIRTVFRWSGTGMWTYQNPVTVEARILPRNKIEIEAKNLGSARLLFSSDMVDFSRAVSIIVNKKTVFEGFLEEKISTVLNDQLLLGRGWRPYTAAYDLDLFPPPTTAPSTRP